jgi:hypothetical protein
MFYDTSLVPYFWPKPTSSNISTLWLALPQLPRLGMAWLDLAQMALAWPSWLGSLNFYSYT